jgi:hypothetical protein
MGAFGSALTFGGALRHNINGVTMTIAGMTLLAGALGSRRFLLGRSAATSGRSSANESGIPHHHNGAGGNS